MATLKRLASRVWPRCAPQVRRQREPLGVMFLITSMPVGGAEVLLVNLIEQFDAEKIRPEIVCMKQPGPLGERVASRWPVHANLLASKFDVRVLPRLIRLLRRRNAAAVVTVGAGDKMFWGRLAAWCAGVPVIASALHSTGWPDGVGRVNRWLTPITDAFIAVADHHARHMSEVERFPANRVHTIRNGIDTTRFVADADARQSIRGELGVTDGAPLVGIVAALRPEKNHAMFVRVAKRLTQRHPDAHFVIVGDGPERGRIERMIGDLGLGGRTHLLGTRHDTPAIMAALDLFLLCSRNEASPVCILEALSCGVPIIATDVGSVRESVVDGETGFVVNVDDDAAMADAAENLLGDPALRREFGERGRDLVCERGSLASMVEGYTCLIESLYDARALPQSLASHQRASVKDPGSGLSRALSPPWRTHRRMG